MKQLLVGTLLWCVPFIIHASSLTVESTAPTAQGSIPRGAQRIPMTSLTLRASCDDDVTVDSLRLTHSGLGDSRDISRIYLMDGQRRISRAHTLSSKDRSADIRLRTFVIPKCSSVVLTVMADFSPTATSGGLHALSLEHPEDIASDAQTVEVVSTAITPQATVPARTGTVQVEYAEVNGRITYGAGRTLARIRITGRERDQDIVRIVLTNDGSAKDGDLRNLYLELSSGAQVSGVLPALDGDTAAFDLEPALALDKNQTKLIELKADVRASRRRTIRFVIEEPSDIEATLRRRR